MHIQRYHKDTKTTRNVALWLGNDEGLYNFARQLGRAHPTRKAAARAFVLELQDMGIFGTPDGR